MGLKCHRSLLHFGDDIFSAHCIYSAVVQSECIFQTVIARINSVFQYKGLASNNIKRWVRMAVDTFRELNFLWFNIFREWATFCKFGYGSSWRRPRLQAPTKSEPRASDLQCKSNRTSVTPSCVNRDARQHRFFPFSSF